jgi:hypothetical protein
MQLMQDLIASSEHRNLEVGPRMSGISLRNYLDAKYVYFASASIIFFVSMQIFDLNNREIRSTDPSHHVTDFGVTTSTSNLRKHLFTDHIGKWTASCENLNIPITTPAAIEAIRKFRKEPATTSLESERPQYSKEAFIEALVDFVVGDDQVHFLF